MDLHVKLNPIPELLCVACLRNDRQTNLPIFGEHEIEAGILSTYKDFIIQPLSDVTSVPVGFCLECMEMLSNINKFKRKCRESVQCLSARAPAVTETCIDDEKPCASPIIMEEEYLEEDFENESIQEQLKDLPKTPIVSVRTLPEDNYCHICCFDHKNIRNHAVDLHAKPLENNLIKCLLCEEDFEGVDKLLVHQKTDHEEFENPRKCVRCEVFLKKRKDFVLHVQTHFETKKLMYVCEFCNFVTETRSKLKNHLPRHFGALKCPHCARHFYDKDQLTLHSQSHTEQNKDKRSICHYCGISFKYKYTLVYHMRKQHMKNEETFKCNQCDRTCLTSFKLKSHIKSVHNERNIPCTHCGKKFKLNGSLSLHIRTMHSNIKKEKRKRVLKMPCDQCDKMFYCASHLKKHQYSHTKTRPFNCHICSTGYYMIQYLQKHYFRDHKKSYSFAEIRKLCGLRPTDWPT